MEFPPNFVHFFSIESQKNVYTVDKIDKLNFQIITNADIMAFENTCITLEHVILFL